MATKTQNILIPADVLQAVLNYMAARPWQEVAGVMPKLLDLKPATEQQT